jgi:hypothetical protein
MFFFSITGSESAPLSHPLHVLIPTDVTYILSILLVSLDSHYLLANASWLAGSASTILLDIFVLGQFGVYSLQDKRKRDEERVFVDDGSIGGQDRD